VASEKIGEVLGAIGPEIVYFTDHGQGRGATMSSISRTSASSRT
jgi:hypothetical protein